VLKGIAKKAEIQVAMRFGRATPLSVKVDTFSVQVIAGQLKLLSARLIFASGDY
jgi:S-adenosylmethionine synthetase